MTPSQVYLTTVDALFLYVHLTVQQLALSLILPKVYFTAGDGALNCH